ncbi:MAG: acetate--CoA ligase family protein, partial [Candidatus Omnitrophica bacterium]|nr:acetate--CoA ligase family protein [Candidatus Omnitrophota bacterium]
MIAKFFQPESVAVVGASREESKLGHRLLKNVIEAGFPGRIYPVNPKADEVLGLKCYPDITYLPETPDLAVIVIPSGLVVEVVRRYGQRGGRAVIVISAGFKEAGEEGKRREEELVATCRQYGVRLIGPNCLGLMDTSSKLNASFAFDMPLPGNIAFISQSGALGTGVLDWSLKEEVGFSKFVSVGNMADVSEGDLLEFLADDPTPRVILVYLEGVRDGCRFLRVARQVTRKKPVIVVKSGRTSAGLKAVSSHTGSLAGSDAAFQAAFKQAGVLRAGSVQELFDYSLAFAYQPEMTGQRIAVVTNAGGPSVMAVDAVERAGLKLAVLSKETKDKLKSFLPVAANTANPVDVLGDALAKPYGQALETVANDSSVDALVAILTPQVVTQPRESAEEVARVARSFRKPVVACFMGGKRIEPANQILAEKKIPNYPFPERAVMALQALSYYHRQRTREVGEKLTVSPDSNRVKAIFQSAKAQGGILGDGDSREVLASYGIPVIPSLLTTSAKQCGEIARKVGFPVVLKLVSPDILHKTEAGAVRLGITTKKQAEKAYQEMIEKAQQYHPGAKIIGIQVQKQLEKAVEVIIGVSQDQQFGHLVMFGLGGVLVELMKDVTFRVIPITSSDIEEMLEEVRGIKLLRGFRNTPPGDIEAVKDVLLRVSCLVEDFPVIKELDINPLMVFPQGKGVLAVDARIALNFSLTETEA